MVSSRRACSSVLNSGWLSNGSSALVPVDRHGGLELGVAPFQLEMILDDLREERRSLHRHMFPSRVGVEWVDTHKPAIVTTLQELPFPPRRRRHKRRPLNSCHNGSMVCRVFTRKLGPVGHSAHDLGSVARLPPEYRSKSWPSRPSMGPRVAAIAAAQQYRAVQEARQRQIESASRTIRSCSRACVVG